MVGVSVYEKSLDVDEQFVPTEIVEPPAPDFAGQVGPPVHIADAAVALKALPSEQHMTAPGWVLVTVDFQEATLAFCLALFKLTKTIDAKIPIIAITIKSSKFMFLYIIQS